MSSSLQNERRQGVPTPLDIDAYIDSVALWLDKKLANTEIRTLKRLCGHRHSKQGRPWRSNAYRYRLHLHQPTKEALRFLDEIVTSRGIGYFINWVDLALDYVFHDESEARLFYVFFDQHLIKPWHGRQQLQYVETTRYTSERRWVRNQIILYCDKPSRISGEPCTHLEWRVRTKGATQARKLGDLQNLIAFDHRAFWRTQLVLKQIDFQMLGRQRRGGGRDKKPNLLSYGPLESVDADVRAGHRLARLASYAIYEREMLRWEGARKSYREMMEKHKMGLVRERPYPPIMPDVPSYPTAQTILDFYRKHNWFHPENSMRPIDTEPYLPKGAL